MYSHLQGVEIFGLVVFPCDGNGYGPSTVNFGDDVVPPPVKELLKGVLMTVILVVEGSGEVADITLKLIGARQLGKVAHAHLKVGVS